MYERFTDRARIVLHFANHEAHRFCHEYLAPEHILLGLCKEGHGVAAHALKNLDIDLRKIRLEVEKSIASGPEMVAMGKLPQSPEAKLVLKGAIQEAKSLHHDYVGTEHLLLGLLRPELAVAGVWKNLGVTADEVREEVVRLLGVEKEKPNRDTKQQIEMRFLDAAGSPITLGEMSPYWQQKAEMWLRQVNELESQIQTWEERARKYARDVKKANQIIQCCNEQSQALVEENRELKRQLALLSEAKKAEAIGPDHNQKTMAAIGNYGPSLLAGAYKARKQMQPSVLGDLPQAKTADDYAREIIAKMEAGSNTIEMPPGNFYSQNSGAMITFPETDSNGYKWQYEEPKGQPVIKDPPHEQTIKTGGPEVVNLNEPASDQSWRERPPLL